MSEFSVNDHLEGILSDFEALKRSFEIDDVDDIPSAPSPIISPGSSHLLLNHNNKANETRGGGGGGGGGGGMMMMMGVPTSPASAYGNINNNGNHGSSMAYRSRLGLGVGPSPAQSPVLKSRAVGSLGTSLSFNRGTMGKPAFSNNGTGPSGGGVTRAASFQNRFNPNGYSSSSMLSGPGSDNDSLHSSSSSLEYSSSSGTMQPPPLTKMGSFPSSPPPPSGEYHPHQYQQQQQQHLLLAQQRAREMQPQGGGGGGVVLGGGNHVLKKFSSHGSVFHSELDDGPGSVLGGGGHGGHGSMPSLDLQSGEGGGGGGGGARRASGAMSPGLRYGSAAWNGRSHSTAAATTGKESYYNSNSQNHVQPPSPHTPHTPHTPQTPKAKETPRLHKFPLDLDSLVGSPAGATKPQSGAPSPTPPRPPPRSHYPAGPPSASASPSASLSSLDSASDTTPPLSLHHPLSPLSSPFPPPASPPGSTPVPEVSCSPVPLSPAQSPQLEQLCGPQAVAVAPGAPRPGMRPAEDGQGEARESVGSILQRIASFSRPIVVADAGAPPAAVAPPPRAPPAAVAPPPRAPPAAVAPPPRASPAAVAPPPRALSNGVKRNAGPALQRQECVAPAETAPPPTPEQRLGKKMHEETAKVSETDTPTAMEEREAEPEKAARGEGEEGGGGGVGGNERESNGQTPAQSVDATPVVASSDQTPSREKEENSSEAKVEEEKKNDGVTNIVEVEVEKEPVIPVSRPAPTPAPGPGVGVLRGSELFGYVGIEAVLDQMRRKTMKAGFEFNIMVVGQSGLGKSTLVNTLFKSKVSRKSCTPNYEEKISKTVKLQSVSHMIEEKGVKMKLTVIDTPGFGDQINNENCWEPIEKYVNEQYEKYLREELHVNRKRRIPDSRIHCCVYFLPATGHWLRPIDIEFMKRLGKIVSIVPVIAKSDTLTIEERLEFKQRIRQDLVANGIRVYPQKEFDEDTEERMVNDRIRENIPFAVVGTDKEHQVNGNKVLGRKTKWGIIEVENVAHCEFANLRDLLIRSHLQDLKDVTHDIHYETYRVRRLNESNMTLNGLALATRPLENGTAHNNKSDSESHL